MGSDVPRLRYLLPRFKGNYTEYMRTLQSSCAFDASDIAKFRLKVIEFGKKHGVRAAVDAFGVKRSTYFLWKKKMTVTQGKLSCLVPLSTRPKRVRQMRVNPQILEFIKDIRQQYGRVGKQKLQILLSAYCKDIGISPIQATAIGKIIKRNKFFFEGKRIYRKSRQGVLRARKAPKESSPGYIEMDSVVVYVNSSIHFFITAIDVVTKYAICLHATTHTHQLEQKNFLRLFIQHINFPSVQFKQTMEVSF